MKKLKKILFTPDEYDGITWFDVVCACMLSSGFFTLIIYLIKTFG